WASDLWQEHKKLTLLHASVEIQSASRATPILCAHTNMLFCFISLSVCVVMQIQLIVCV
ncbi:hypothetical protein ACJX0J_031863, partial [Zea mays]